MKLPKKFQLISPQGGTAGIEGPSASIGKYGTGFALTIYLPNEYAKAGTKTHEYAEIYVNKEDRQVAMRMNSDREGFKLARSASNKKFSVRLITAKGGFREKAVRVGAIEDVQKKNEFVIITLPSIYWEHTANEKPSSKASSK